jgi:hypothetical protein
VLMGTVTMVSCGAAASPARGPVGEQVQSTWTALTVLHCNTVTPWTSPPRPKASPHTERVRVPDHLLHKLVVYEDSLGVLLVSPIGWSCSASYGADGSGKLEVRAPAGVPSRGSREQLNAIWQGACVGCTESQACPLFSAAALAYRESQGRNCPFRKPKHEIVQHFGLHVVAFTDPPGVRGDGVPSGGADPDRGAMTFYLRSSQGPQSRVANCYVPRSDDSLCNVVLDQFIDWEGGAGPPPDR